MGYKMKGFSGYGNESPLKQNKSYKGPSETEGDISKAPLGERTFPGLKGLGRKTRGWTQRMWDKYGPVINPSTKTTLQSAGPDLKYETVDVDPGVGKTKYRKHEFTKRKAKEEK